MTKGLLKVWNDLLSGLPRRLGDQGLQLPGRLRRVLIPQSIKVPAELAGQTQSEVQEPEQRLHSHLKAQRS